MQRCAIAASLRRVAHQELIAELAALPHTLAPRARIVVRDGVIESVDTHAPSKDARFLPGTLMPGFVDLQVNGAAAQVARKRPRRRSSRAHAHAKQAARLRSCPR